VNQNVINPYFGCNWRS